MQRGGRSTECRRNFAGGVAGIPSFVGGALGTSWPLLVNEMRRADARVPSSAERVLKIGGISALVAPGGGFNPVHGMSVFFDSKSSVILVEYSPAQPGPCDGAVLLDDRLCVSRGTVLVMAVAEEDPKVRWARKEKEGRK